MFVATTLALYRGHKITSIASSSMLTVVYNPIQLIQLHKLSSMHVEAYQTQKTIGHM